MYPSVDPHDLKENVKGNFLHNTKIRALGSLICKVKFARNRARENRFQLTSLFSSTADILFMYNDMETFVNSPVRTSHRLTH
jgi:hypothetical protein